LGYLLCVHQLSITLTNTQDKSSEKEKRFILADSVGSFTPCPVALGLWLHSTLWQEPWQKGPVHITVGK
jgi:hypothetical protein